MRTVTNAAMALLAVLYATAACAKDSNAEHGIVLGAPLSTNYLYGWDAERGLRLAVEEINAAGGVDVGGQRRPFVVEVLDTRDCEPGVPISDALLAVEKLILQKGADFIVGGPVRSEAALAAMSLVAKHRVVSMLSTGALTPKYHEEVRNNYDKYKYCFRVSGEAKWMVKEIVDVLESIRQERGFDRISIMIEDVAHARAGGQTLERLLAKKGWSILDHDAYPTGASDFSSGLLRAKAKRAQILLLWMDMPESSILLEQWYKLQVPALPFGSILSAAEQPGFWKATKGKGEYTLANLVNAGNARTKLTEWAGRFYDAYEKRWGVPPEGYGAASSYMVPWVLKDAIERAGSLEAEKVIAALEQTDLMGVYGRIRFDPRSHQVLPARDPDKGAVGTMIQWQAGERVTVFPPRAAVGTLQLPPWMQK